MNDFKLPVIKGMKENRRIFSMDEYHQFVMFNLKNAFDREAYKWWKERLVVNIPFSLKDTKGK